MKKFRTTHKKLLSLLLVMIMLVSTAPANLFSVTASAVSGSEIVAYARQFLGYPYVWGAEGPDSFDCSGLVQYVFAHFGISLPRTTDYYWNNPTAYGTVVGTGSTANARAGDIISWSGHVAIYTENGYCVEALNPSYGVTDKIKVDSHTNGLNYRVIRVYGVSDYISEPPVIKKVEISNVSTAGYTATCIVDNGFKVSYGDFMIWTESNGQDDIQQYRGTLTDNKIVINVKASAHNGETGKYITHLYIWYNGGTKSISVALPAVVLADKEPPQVSNMKITNVTESGYTVTCGVTDASDVILADFLVWTSQNGQDDIGSFQGTISKNNVVTINVKSSDHNSEKGEYITHLYVYDSAGNSKGYAFPSVNLSGYKITLNYKDESDTTLNKKKTYGIDFVLDAFVPSRDGYNFLGWATDKNATEPEYLPGDTYSENKDITLYAVWEEITYTNLIQGTVTSFGDGNEEIILKKKDSTQESYAVVAFTNEDTYSVCDPEGKIEPGEYILSVSKENHVTREYSVTIGEETVNIDIQLNLIGDINGDGKINVMDYSNVLRHAKKTENLEDYAFLCADVDGNGKVTVSDYARILRHVKKTDPLW